MFSKQFRLPATTVLQNPKHIQTPYFSFKVGKNLLEHNRYGFVISKQVDKRATVRNSIKRKIRSFFESQNTKITQGVDVLIIIKKAALDVETKELWKVVEDCLKESYLI